VKNEAHFYSYIMHILPSLHTIHFYPAIVLSIFMLSFIFVVVCNLFKWKRITEYKKIMIYGVGNVGPDLSQAQTCGGVKPVNGIPTPALDNRNLNVITFINKR
jgi:hypothetical protein